MSTRCLRCALAALAVLALGQPAAAQPTPARAFCAENAEAGVYAAGCPVQYSRGGG